MKVREESGDEKGVNGRGGGRGRVGSEWEKGGVKEESGK